MSETLDRRLNAFRPDLAHNRLEGQVKAARFVAGRAAMVTASVADMCPSPDESRGIDTQLLRGALINVLDIENGWAWCQADRDGYVGYVKTDALSLDAEQIIQPTHYVCVPRSFTYSDSDLKRPMVNALSLGSAVVVTGETENRGTHYALLNDGTAMIAKHLRPIGDFDNDYVTFAESLLNTPYLWGGTSAFGIDCSGLVQLSMLMTGMVVLRDSDMQEASIGEALAPDAPLQRGDLVFWKGHVGIMRDKDTLIHANAHTMQVSYEPLEEAIERIAYLYGEPTSRRRP